MVKDVQDDKGNEDSRSSNPWSGDSKLGVSNLLGIVIVIVLVATIAIGAPRFYDDVTPLETETTSPETTPPSEPPSEPEVVSPLSPPVVSSSPPPPVLASPGTTRLPNISAVGLGFLLLVITYGLLNEKRWAWVLTIILLTISIVLNAITITIGTVSLFILNAMLLIISGIILYYFFRPHVRAYFGK